MNRVPRKGRRCPIAIGNSECCDSKGSSSISRAVWSAKAWQCGNLDHLCLYPAYLSLFADPNRRSHAVIRGDHNMYDYFRFCPGIVHAVRSDNTFPMPQFVGFCCPTSKEHHTQAERPTNPSPLISRFPYVLGGPRGSTLSARFSTISRPMCLVELVIQRERESLLSQRPGELWS